MIQWHCKTFDELSTSQLYDILRIRQDVFIIEQQCIYPDLDNLDQQSRHLFAYDEDTTAMVAYLRIIPAKLQYPQASFGRVLTTSQARGTGIGKTLISKAIEQIRLDAPQQAIKISAQLYLQTFYQGFGFKVISDVYDEDGIDHISMLLD
jgi:ElaA protein